MAGRCGIRATEARDQDSHYLAAKKRVDDRSINRRVWQTVWAPLHGRSVRVLEVGAGIGTMAQRVMDWSRLAYAEYTAVDINDDLLGQIPGRMDQWGRAHGFTVSSMGEDLELSSPDRSLRMGMVQADVRHGLPESLGREFDVVIACALLDLVGTREVLPELLGRLAPDGTFYFPINFDGMTVFWPPTDPETDSAIERSYHRTMDVRDGGSEAGMHSQTGRRLLSYLPNLGAEISAAGASDWIVHPVSGGYGPDEQIVLEWMLGSIERAVGGAGDVEQGVLSQWLTRRRGQLAEGTLTMLVHQIDLCGGLGAPPLDHNQPG